ncbi:STAS domain-containing protein [Catellatospora bangladeshensis]|uniref:STAS domain-containing protein n=1 Tax=Catellatospora bangladeshensis TaxID=310355 RepID=UPI001944B37E|nr:STAS domain-containing protein [Catellatospora bangladeshensis]
MIDGHSHGLVAAWRIPEVEVSIVGDLDAWSAGHASQVLDEAMRFRPEVLVLDMARCRSLDTAGALLIVQTHQRMRYSGGSLSVRSALPQVVMTLRAADEYGALHVVGAGQRLPRHAADGR